jgi:hypothetical protein
MKQLMRGKKGIILSKDLRTKINQLCRPVLKEPL